MLNQSSSSEYALSLKRLNDLVKDSGSKTHNLLDKEKSRDQIGSAIHAIAKDCNNFDITEFIRKFTSLNLIIKKEWLEHWVRKILNPSANPSEFKEFLILVG